MSRWLKEPLLHFLIIGAGLFILYGWQADENTERPRQIVFTEADVDRLINLWERKWQRLPNTQELQGLINQQVREEVLYREALAMGLDKDDVVVRRRLSQKMEFIFNDLASLAEPDDTQLQQYLENHADSFADPGRISFRQVYLNPDQRGEQVFHDAETLLEELSASTAAVDFTTLGDRLMGQQNLVDETDFGVSRLFGQAFAKQVFSIPVGAWSGPIKSGYGLHLVYIDSRTDPRVPELEQVRNEVRDEWLAEQQRITNEQLYSELLKGYEIKIEGLTTDLAALRDTD